MKGVLGFLKYYKVPLILFLVAVGVFCYVAWDEYRFNTILVDQALKGNRYAVKILMKYNKPYKLDRRIVRSALEGNRYALEVLQIEDTNSQESSYCA